MIQILEMPTCVDMMTMMMGVYLPEVVACSGVAFAVVCSTACTLTTCCQTPRVCCAIPELSCAGMPCAGCHRWSFEEVGCGIMASPSASAASARKALGLGAGGLGPGAQGSGSGTGLGPRAQGPGRRPGRGV